MFISIALVLLSAVDNCVADLSSFVVVQKQQTPQSWSDEFAKTAVEIS